nr:putative ribonuclease H-like domain-containing protein [Tanacetum cinerariifolium]
MTSLANKAILSGADNRPPMLEKDMYDSWKIRMELYMLNKQHGRMILESVESGPLLWPTIKENGVTRLKKYFELSTTEAIQADCDVKATNIILQGLPPEVYALVSTHKVAKELWEIIQMLMQGTSLTKQERACKLDYAGAHGDRKSTTGGCQFLRRRLNSWQCKEQTFVATSSCKAEYVVVASCCGQRFLLLATNSDGWNGFCWWTFISAASEVSLPDGVKGLVATIDGTAYTVTEASIRSALQLDDLNAIDTLTNAEIFDGLRAIRYATEGKFMFFKKNSPQWKFLIHPLIHCISPKSGSWNQFASNIAIALICLLTGRKYNFSNMIFNGMCHNVSSRTKFLMYPPFLQIILDTKTEDTTPYPAPLVTNKFFANMRHYQGPDMSLLAHMLNQGEPALIHAQPQEVSPPPPSHVVEPHPLTDPMPSPPMQSSPSPPMQSSPSPITFGPAPSSGVAFTNPIPKIPSLSRTSKPVLQTITSPIRDDDIGGGSFHESPPSPPLATLTRSPTVGVVKEPLTLNSLLALFPTCLQRIATLEAELKATKILHRDAVVVFAKRIKKLESKLKTKKRKLVLSDSENKEEARQSQELDALLHLANADFHDPSASTTPSKPDNQEQSSEQEITKIIYKRLKKQQSSSGLDFTDATIPAARRVFAGGADPDVVVSAGGADSAGTFIYAGVSVAVGPSVPSAPSSPIRDPVKGKAVATPSSPITAPTDKELADQQAVILEAKQQELLEQELKQSLDAEQVYLDGLLAQRVVEEQERESRASAAQSIPRQAELDRIALNLTNEEWIGLVDQVRANLTLSAKLLGADVSQDTFSVWMVKLMNQQQKAISEMKAKAKRHIRIFRVKEIKEFSQHKQSAKLQETTTVFAGATIAVGDPISVVPSISVASSIPVETPIVAGVSTTADVSESAKQAVPLRKTSRKKSMARRRTLSRPSQSESASLPFNEDDPEAEFKKYLRQVSDDDEPAEPVSLSLVSDIRTWEIIPTEFGLGEIHVIIRADGSVKRFSTLRELMHWVGCADLMVLYGMVLDKYKVERATSIGLGLWSDLRMLITVREDRDASIIWDDQDQ